MILLPVKICNQISVMILYWTFELMKWKADLHHTSKCRNKHANEDAKDKKQDDMDINNILSKYLLHGKDALAHNIWPRSDYLAKIKWSFIVIIR